MVIPGGGGGSLCSGCECLWTRQRDYIYAGLDGG